MTRRYTFCTRFVSGMWNTIRQARFEYQCRDHDIHTGAQGSIPRAQYLAAYSSLVGGGAERKHLISVTSTVMR